MRVAIIGSRKTDKFTVEQMIQRIPLNTTRIISGGAKGVDMMAEQAAALLDLPMIVFMPDYDKNGKKAPFIRNKQIVDAADIVLAFWDGHSRGTANTLKYCIESYKAFRIYLFESMEKEIELGK